MRTPVYIDNVMPQHGLIMWGALYLGAMVIDEKALVPIGSTLVVSGGAWWMGRKLQQIDDKLKTLTEKTKRHEQCQNFNPR